MLTEETITWQPLCAGLPKVRHNVLLALRDGTTCEGFRDDDRVSERFLVGGVCHHTHRRTVFRDVTADELDEGDVTHWASKPRGPNV